MTQRCKNCGAELFAGQQFCRQCGARTGLLAPDDMATRILPGQAPTATAPLGGERQTDPGFGARPTGAAYQPPQQVVPLQTAPPAPARRRLGAGLVVLLACLVLLGLTTVGVGLFFAQRAQRGPVARKIVINPPHPPAVPHPPAPPVAPDADEAGDFDTLDESQADVSDDKTVITKSFPLKADAGQFELFNLNGDIKIEGWDEPQAEVKVIKRGGDPDEREATEIKVQQTGDRLELRTAPGGGGVEDVTYEVHLPRRLTHVRLSATNGDVKLSGVRGQIEITTQQGNVKLEGVSGAITTKTVTGNTKVVLADAAADAPQTFTAVSGNVEVQLGNAPNVELQADTTGGEITLPDSLGLKVEKHLVGQHVAGTLGRGGPPLAIRTVSGNIKIKQ